MFDGERNVSGNLRGLLDGRVDLIKVLAESRWKERHTRRASSGRCAGSGLLCALGLWLFERVGIGGASFLGGRRGSSSNSDLLGSLGSARSSLRSWRRGGGSGGSGSIIVIVGVVAIVLLLGGGSIRSNSVVVISVGVSGSSIEGLVLLGALLLGRLVFLGRRRLRLVIDLTNQVLKVDLLLYQGLRLAVGLGDLGLGLGGFREVVGGAGLVEWSCEFGFDPATTQARE